MIHSVELSPLALADLERIANRIAQVSDVETALAYLRRVPGKVSTLRNFPAQGTSREDLGFGVRTISFERRLTIAHRIAGDVVRIERVIDGRQDRWTVG